MVARHGRWYLLVLPWLASALFVVLVTELYGPALLAGLAGAWFGRASRCWVEARGIDRFERERGVRVVHVRENLLEPNGLRVVAH